MAFITRKITRTSQPQELVGIDWSNPLTAGLVFATDEPSRLRDSVSGVFPSATVGGIGSAVTKYGKAIDFSSDVFSYGNVDLLAGVTNATFQIIEIPNSTEQVAGIVNKRLAHNNQNSYSIGYNYVSNQFTVEIGSSLGTQPIIAYGFNLASFSTSGNSIVTTINGTAAAGEKVKLWNNGISVAIVSVPLDSAISGFFYGTAPLELGRVNSGALYYGGKLVLARIWNRNISESEAKSLSDNPWQIFEPIEETIWIPDGVSVTLPTLVQPASTTSAGAWTATGAATLHEAIDEATPSDADYISVAAASTCELVLADSAFPTGNVSLAYRALSSTASTLTVTLKQGATTIMTRTHALTGTTTLYTQALTAGEVAAIVAGPITCTLTSS